jgi:putative peptidoglycan lipid II flippase
MAETAPTRRGFERHALTVTLLTGASRFGGLIREACFSRLIGLTEVASAFGFAFQIPNLFRRLFGEGALSAALVPEQTRLELRHPDAARRLASSVLSWLAILLGAITILAEIVLWSLPEAVETPGLRLLAIMLPYMPLVCIAAIAGAVLQVRGRFGPAAAAPILLNASLVAAVVVAWWLGGREPVDEGGIGIVAWGVVLAGILQATWTLVALHRTRPATTDADPARTRRRVRQAQRRVLLQSIPMIIGLGVLQLNTFLDGLVASWPTFVGPTILGHEYPLGVDAMATLTYASRLYEFPLGVFGIAIATAIFPQLAREVGDRDRFADTIRRGLRLGLFIGIPASVGVILVREPLVTVVLQGGAFDGGDSAKVAVVLFAYATAIWSYSTTHLLVRAFYARREPMTAVWIAVSMVGLNLTLNLVLVFGTSLGVAGLAWSTAVCSVIQSGILVRVLAARTGILLDAAVRRSIVRTIGSTAAMGVVVWALLEFVPFDRIGGAWVSSLVALVVASGAGAAVHGAISRSWRMPELGWALGRDRG